MLGLNYVPCLHLGTQFPGHEQRTRGTPGCSLCWHPAMACTGQAIPCSLQCAPSTRALAGVDGVQLGQERRKLGCGAQEAAVTGARGQAWS